MNKSEKVRQALIANPNADVSELASKFDLAVSQVYKIRKTFRDAAQRPEVKPKPAIKAQPAVKEEIDVLSKIRRIKAFANDFGGMEKLAELIEELK